MMSVPDSISEVSGYCELIKVATVLYSVPHHSETALIKGRNETHTMAGIVQRHTQHCAIAIT